jgi:DNA-binding NtrC family response regulator
MAKLLIVENEPVTLNLLSTLLKGEDHEVTSVDGAEAALELLSREPYDVLLTDIRMEPVDGMELLKQSRQQYPDLPVIMLTAYGSVTTAVEALKLGAFDYLTKPFKVDELISTTERALAYVRQRQENLSAKMQSAAALAPGELVSESAAMQRVCELIRRVAPTSTTVLIQGEAGTDKQAVANAIHHCSNRKNKPFIALDAGTIASADLEGALFGLADTDSDEGKAGLFEAAGDGTAFLTGLDSLPTTVQQRLLTLLQQREAKRVGGSAVYQVTARLIVASDQPLAPLVEQGDFLEDLYLRLRVILIDIPALRQRPDDILPTASHLLRQHTAGGDPLPALDPAACEILLAYTWPGNEQQLESVLKQAIQRAGGGGITADMLPSSIREEARQAQARQPAAAAVETAASLKAFLKEKEKEYLRQVLANAQGDEAAAAAKLHMSVDTLQKTLR